MRIFYLVNLDDRAIDSSHASPAPFLGSTAPIKSFNIEINIEILEGGGIFPKLLFITFFGCSKSKKVERYSTTSLKVENI